MLYSKLIQQLLEFIHQFELFQILWLKQVWLLWIGSRFLDVPVFNLKFNLTKVTTFQRIFSDLSESKNIQKQAEERLGDTWSRQITPALFLPHVKSSNLVSTENPVFPAQWLTSCRKCNNSFGVMCTRNIHTQSFFFVVFYCYLHFPHSDSLWIYNIFVLIYTYTCTSDRVWKIHFPYLKCTSFATTV